MNPDLSLAIAGLFAGFVLKTTVAFSVCLILSRLVTSASHRFTLWAVFLYGSAAYWLYLAGTLLPHRQAAAAALPQPVHPATTAFSMLEFWSIPESWGFSLGVTLGLLGLVYLLVLGYNVLSHANKLRHLRWVMGFTTEPPTEIAEMFRSLAKNLGIRPPRLLMLAGASSPATFGWLRPVILLPTLCVEQDPSDLQDILLHELHHVRRRDSFWNALGIAARAVLCFHPAAWYAMKTMRFDRELACDSAVVSRSPGRRGVYAESLLHFARLNMSQDPVSWGIDFAASSEHLTVRVHSILTEARKISPWMFWLRTGSGLALLAAFAGVAPSLAILLGYTHPLAQRTESAITVPATNELKVARTARKRPALSSPAARVLNADPATTQTEVISPATDIAAATDVVEQRSLPTSPGPHLQHRPAAGTGNSTTHPKSIALIDDSDSGQSGKHGDTGQTVQQSATVAAAIWKRVGDLDRH